MAARPRRSTLIRISLHDPAFRCLRVRPGRRSPSPLLSSRWSWTIRPGRLDECGENRRRVAADDCDSRDERWQRLSRPRGAGPIDRPRNRQRYSTTKPRASAPASAHRAASPAVVMPPDLDLGHAGAQPTCPSARRSRARCPAPPGSRVPTESARRPRHRAHAARRPRPRIALSQSTSRPGPGGDLLGQRDVTVVDLEDEDVPVDPEDVGFEPERQHPLELGARRGLRRASRGRGPGRLHEADEHGLADHAHGPAGPPRRPHVVSRSLAASRMEVLAQDRDVADATRAQEVDGAAESREAR